MNVTQLSEKVTDNSENGCTSVLQKWYTLDEQEVLSEEGGGIMYTIFDVANFFLSKEEMTHKKLQKLCYYAQAWYCALHQGEPLVDAEFQAWVHGPVAPELYSRYADRGWSPIPKIDSKPQMREETMEFLDMVYNTYEDLDGDDLEYLTHQESPWINARKGLEALTPSRNVMHEYYLSLYQEEQND